MPRRNNNKKMKGKAKANRNNPSKVQAVQEAIDSLCPEQRQRLVKALEDAINRKKNVVAVRDSTRAKMAMMDDVLPLFEVNPAGTTLYHQRKVEVTADVDKLDNIVEGLDKMIATFRATLALEDAALAYARDHDNFNGKGNDQNEPDPSGGMGGISA